MKKIFLNRIYVLDTGNNHELIVVRVIKVGNNTIQCRKIKDEKIECQKDFVTHVPYHVFKQNGYEK